MPVDPKTIGYILIAPGRPAIEEQYRRLALFGVHEEDVWIDEIDRGSTRPRSQLVAREDMVEALKPGQSLVAAGRLCVALSRLDAEWLLQALRERQVSLIIASDVDTLAPGDDYEELLERIGSAQNVQNVRMARQRAKEARKDAHVS